MRMWIVTNPYNTTEKDLVESIKKQFSTEVKIKLTEEAQAKGDPDPILPSFLIDEIDFSAIPLPHRTTPCIGFVFDGIEEIETYAAIVDKVNKLIGSQYVPQ